MECSEARGDGVTADEANGDTDDNGRRSGEGKSAASCHGGLKNESLRDFLVMGVVKGAGVGVLGIRGVTSASGAAGAGSGMGGDGGELENGEAKNAFVFRPLDAECSPAEEDGEGWSP